MQTSKLFVREKEEDVMMMMISMMRRIEMKEGAKEFSGYQIRDYGFFS